MNRHVYKVFNSNLINKQLFLILFFLTMFTSSCNIFNPNYISFNLCFDLKQNKFHHTIETGFFNHFCISRVGGRRNPLDSCLSRKIYALFQDTLFINLAYMGKEGFNNDFSDNKSTGIIIKNIKMCKNLNLSTSNSEYFIIQEFKDLSYDEIVNKISTIKVQYAIFNNEKYNYHRDTIIMYFNLKKCCE